jgi:hypothetical protein
MADKTRFWEAKPKAGRKSEYGPASNLAMVAYEYFKWVEDNPLDGKEVTKYKNETKVISVPKMRPMTQKGFCIFIGISEDTLANWLKRPEYVDVITNIKAIIYEQKFAGAAADLMNANLISRDLGLADKKEVKAELEHTNLTEEQLDAKIRELNER